MKMYGLAAHGVHVVRGVCNIACTASGQCFQWVSWGCAAVQAIPGGAPHPVIFTLGSFISRYIQRNISVFSMFHAASHPPDSGAQPHRVC
jgi:hypothetical protein